MIVCMPQNVVAYRLNAPVRAKPHVPFSADITNMSLPRPSLASASAAASAAVVIVLVLSALPSSAQLAFGASRARLSHAYVPPPQAEDKEEEESTKETRQQRQGR